VKVASFRVGGVPSFGVVTEGTPEDGKLVDCSGFDPQMRSVLDVLTAKVLPELAAWAMDRSPDVSLADVDLLPPVLGSSKILCAGVNYASHRDEAQQSPQRYPTIFSRYADTQVGHGDSLLHPGGDSCLDWEGELVAVIGRSVYQESPQQAADAVVAWSCYDDASVRDWQFRTTQWLPGKNFAATGGFGPWLVTGDEVGPVEDLRLETRVNGIVVQDAPMSDMIFDVPHLISYISTFTPLSPGDLVVTGTPSGVGYFREPQWLLEPGDVVEVDIDSVGTLRNVVSST
jgi:2-keto-4-pentenoate hydratase/2-oxohepta-3-ene-1,7-dioic acid hydratase in catechol pathway